jgi:polar amino acid transport system substrate-binding protein
MRVYKLAAAAIAVGAALAGCSSSSGSSSSGGGTGAAVSSSCKPAHPGIKTLTKGTLLVLTYVSPPYTIQDGSTIGGVDGTIVAKLAQMECLKLDAQPTAPAALAVSLQSGRGDVGDGGIYYTAQRAQILGLSVPMYRDGMALVSKKPLTGTLAGLAGKSLGVIQGYLWDNDFQKALGSNVKIYQSSPSMISDIEVGRLDAGVLTTSEAGYRVKHGASLVVTPFQSSPQIAASQSQNNVVLAVYKSESSLLQALDADIQTLISDGFIASTLTAQGLPADMAGSSS